MNKDVHFWACLRLIFARASYLSCLFAKKLTVKGFSERTGMSVVLLSSDVFAAQKPVVRTPKDGRDINQKRVLYKTRLFPTYTEVCREKVYTDVHFRTGYFQKS